MNCREKPHMDRYKEITHGWVCDSSCMLDHFSLEFAVFKCLIFVVQCLQHYNCVLPWV
jgi:hypothetical protein